MDVPGQRSTGALVAVVAAGLSGAIGAQSLAIASSWGGWSWVLPGGASAATVCALAVVSLVRPRHVLLLAGVGLGAAALAVATAALSSFELPAEPSPAIAAGLAILIGGVVRRETWLPATVLAVGGLSTIVVGQIVNAQSGTAISGVTLVDILLWSVAVTGGLWLRRLDAEARETVSRVRRAERLELARELHDVVAQHVTGIVVQAQGAQILARRDPDLAVEFFAELEESGAGALAAMRQVVSLLREEGDIPIDYGIEGLDALVNHFRLQGLEVQLDSPGTVDRWPAHVADTVSRVVREALTNVVRHAQGAECVTVTVEQVQSQVNVVVTDDAPAMGCRRQPGGYGLVGMKERVEALGGRLDAGPSPHAGWTVRASLPLSASTAT